MKSTTVIKVSGRDRDRLLADPSFQYVGRKFAGFEGSIFGNPFKPGMNAEDAIEIMNRIPAWDDRSLKHGDPLWTLEDEEEEFDAVNWFGIYVRTRRSLWRRLPELRGKTLGCWCGTWSPGQPDIGCHAVALARLADSWGEYAR
jgi:hypothetical protein